MAQNTSTRSASVKITAVKSQALLCVVAAIVVPAIFYLAYDLLTKDKNAGWAFLGIATVTLMGLYFAWLKSSVNSDLHDSTPTMLESGDGRRVTFDAGLARSDGGMLAVSQAMQYVFGRHALPEADGIVDENLLPIGDSFKQANIQIKQINSEVAQQKNMMREMSGAVAQPHEEDVPKASVPHVGQPQAGPGQH